MLPALLTASAPSKLTIEGGTHNPLAPPFDFLERSFLPLLNRMGPRVAARLERWGFYPAGGGRVVVDIEPQACLTPFELYAPLPVHKKSARAVSANLPASVAERELSVVQEMLGLPRSALHAVALEGGRGRGNVVTIDLETEYHSEVFTGFGAPGVTAAVVAAEVVHEPASISRAAFRSADTWPISC